MLKIITVTIIFILLGCSDRPYLFVKPENFVPVQEQYKTFLFGIYQIDTTQYMILNSTGDESGMILNRDNVNALRPNELEYFLIPVSERQYSIKSVYFTEGAYSDVRKASKFGTGGNYYPVKNFPYSFNIKATENYINYIGRFTLTNGSFSVENRFDDDKALLLSHFRDNEKAFTALSNYQFTNLLQK